MDGPRGLKAQEFDSLCTLVNTVFRGDGVGRMEEQYPLLFAPDNYDELFVMVDEGVVVSHVGALTRDISVLGCRMSTMSIGAVATYESHRGQGLATQLMEAAIRKAVEQDAVLMPISGGRGLYTRLGAKRIGQYALFSVPRDTLPAGDGAARVIGRWPGHGRNGRGRNGDPSRCSGRPARNDPVVRGRAQPVRAIDGRSPDGGRRRVDLRPGRRDRGDPRGRPSGGLRGHPEAPARPRRRSPQGQAGRDSRFTIGSCARVALSVRPLRCGSPRNRDHGVRHGTGLPAPAPRRDRGAPGILGHGTRSPTGTAAAGI